MMSDAVLRMASQNVRGLAKVKAGVLARTWQKNNLDLILLQETHVNNPHERAAIEACLSLYKVVWSFPLGSMYSSLAPSEPSANGRSAPTRACRGVAVCVRRAALAPRGPIAWDDASVVPGNEGRSIAATIRWAGHTIRVVNVYLPNVPAERQRFITSCILPLVTNLPNGTQLVLGGDFNFVMDPAMDRYRPPGLLATRPADPTVVHWTANMPQLTDVFRVRYPQRRDFTWFRPVAGNAGAHSASRIDRFYATPDLVGYMQPMRRCSETDARASVFKLITSADHISDHAMIGVALTAKAPVRQGRSGMGRVRLRFEGREDLVREFKRRAGLLIGTLPADGVRLIKAWPRFKRNLILLVRDMNSQIRCPTSADRAALSSRFSEVIARCQSGDALAFDELPLARRLLVEADQAEARNATIIERRDWLHHGESPGPLLSSQLKRPPGVDSVAALRVANQPLVSDPLRLPDIMALHLAEISARQPVDATAQADVLGSVEPTRRLSQAQCSLLEDVDVSDEEVLKSLKRASPGTSPGPDGLPMDLWRKYRALFAPPLARLFSAIAAGGGLPPGFHDGNITMIFKAGDRTDPANYRPITLLNSDYRAYTRVLASRLGPVLSSVIDSHQTAFLPGRHIGENILLAQALPRALSHANAGAISVACDFRKAYDTVDRDFLYQAMRVMGCGPRFCRMVKDLLTHTKARVELNGFQSRSVAFAVGVRQGCPLAPQLYLFVAQTMSCFLAHRGIGIMIVCGRHIRVPPYLESCRSLPSGHGPVWSCLWAVFEFVKDDSNPYRQFGSLTASRRSTTTSCNQANNAGSTLVGRPVVWHPASNGRLGSAHTACSSAPTKDQHPAHICFWSGYSRVLVRAVLPAVRGRIYWASYSSGPHWQRASCGRNSPSPGPCGETSRYGTWPFPPQRNRAGVSRRLARESIWEPAHWRFRGPAPPPSYPGPPRGVGTTPSDRPPQEPGATLGTHPKGRDRPNAQRCSPDQNDELHLWGREYFSVPPNIGGNGKCLAAGTAHV